MMRSSKMLSITLSKMPVCLGLIVQDGRFMYAACAGCVPAKLRRDCGLYRSNRAEIQERRPSLGSTNPAYCRSHPL